MTPATITKATTTLVSFIQIPASIDLFFWDMIQEMTVPS
jgi:hypothetical protein